MSNNDNKHLDIVKSEKIPREVMRKAFHDVFVAIGGIEHLQQFALDNPKQFYTLIVKLFPEPKEAKTNDIPKHETFIQMIINEDKQKHSELDKPVNMIDITD